MAFQDARLQGSQINILDRLGQVPMIIWWRCPPRPESAETTFYFILYLAHLLSAKGVGLKGGGGEYKNQLNIDNANDHFRKTLTYVPLYTCVIVVDDTI